MLVARRLAELRQLTRQLQRVCREAEQVGRHHPHNKSLSAAEASRVDGGAVVLTSSRPSWGSASPLKGVREKLLFRRVPIGVALLETSLSSLNRHVSRRHPAVTYQEPTKSIAAAAAAHSTREGKNDGEALSFPQVPASASAGRDNDAHPVVVVAQESQKGQRGVDSCVLPGCPEAASPSVSPESPTPPLATDPALASHAQLAAETLSLLCVLEQERRSLLREKQAENRRRVASAEEALCHFHKTALDRGHRKRKGQVTSETSADGVRTNENDEPLAETEATLKESLRLARQDEQLLQQSLLNRPLLSARMWRLLLSERVWLGAIQVQRVASASLRDGGPGATAHPHFLLTLSLLFSRVVLGVMKDYVDGSDINRRSPRFVVSLPSVSFRRAKRPLLEKRKDVVVVVEGASAPVVRERGAPTKDEEPTMGGDDDMLALMFDGARVDDTPCDAAGPTNASPASLPASLLASDGAASALEAVPRRHTGSMRWMPSHAANAFPLLVDTLAMFSFLLPELDCAALVRAGRVEEAACLLTALQKLATIALLFSSGERSRSLHGPLHRLEDGMLAAGRSLREACASALRNDAMSHARGAQPTGANPFATLTPAKGARLAAEMHSLQLLDSRGAQGDDVVIILEALVAVVFPELKTSTLKTLMQKSRQNSLLAFATKQHKRKLFAEHGGPAEAERYLRGTIVQRARLEQRRLAAALRDQHLTNTHLQCVEALGQAVPSYDLITLFCLLVTTVVSSSSPSTLGSRAGGGALGDGRPLPLLSTQSSRLTTAALFAAETLLVSGALHRADGAATGSARVGGAAVEDLVQLWPALATLWPVIDTRRELLLQHQPRSPRSGPSSHHNGKHSSAVVFGSSDVATETTILSLTTELVLSGINGLLAQHLDEVEADLQRARSSRQRNRRAAGTRRLVHAEQLAALALGLLTWHETEPAVRRRRSFTVGQQVQLTPKLMREVALKDVNLWHEVRLWDLGKRAAFERRMLECFRVADLLDNATTKAVERACSAL